MFLPTEVGGGGVISNIYRWYLLYYALAVQQAVNLPANL